MKREPTMKRETSGKTRPKTTDEINLRTISGKQIAFGWSVDGALYIDSGPGTCRAIKGDQLEQFLKWLTPAAPSEASDEDSTDLLDDWLFFTPSQTPARLMYHAFESGMYAGWQGANHKRDCPYKTNDYRMWWMHGCIVGNDRRQLLDLKDRVAAPPPSEPAPASEPAAKTTQSGVGRDTLTKDDKPGWYLCTADTRGFPRDRVYWWNGSELRGYENGHFLCELGNHWNFRGPLALPTPASVTREEVDNLIRAGLETLSELQRVAAERGHWQAKHDCGQIELSRLRTELEQAQRSLLRKGTDAAAD